MTFTFSLAIPEGQHDAVHFPPASEVHHPDGVVHVVVVQDGALVEVVTLVAVDGQLGVAVRPVLPALSLVVHPGRSLVRHILHCRGNLSDVRMLPETVRLCKCLQCRLTNKLVVNRALKENKLLM